MRLVDKTYHRREKNTEYPRVISTYSLGFHPLFIHVDDIKLKRDTTIVVQNF
jgi:hypothetical protein